MVEADIDNPTLRIGVCQLVFSKGMMKTPCPQEFLEGADRSPREPRSPLETRRYMRPLCAPFNQGRLFPQPARLAERGRRRAWPQRRRVYLPRARRAATVRRTRLRPELPWLRNRCAWPTASALGGGERGEFFDVDGNPIGDPTAFRRIVFVMKHGKVYLLRPS
jgi:hypothetical protein